MKLRERIREQSKQVAMYMNKPERYQVLWDCPKCGNSHNWWWEDKYEAWDDGECDMVCDRCMEPSRCKGDGMGFYVPVPEKSESGGGQRSLEAINLTLNELQSGRRAHLSMLTKLSVKADELDDLNTDLHEYVRGLEDKVNRLREDNKLAFDAINTLAKRLADLEHPAPPEATPRKNPPTFLDLIHGERPPFHERLREGCQLEDMSGEAIAAILRFVAVEVERMTERDMGGSFTISNLKVGENLRALADEADEGDWREEEDEGPGWDLTGFDEEGTP